MEALLEQVSNAFTWVLQSTLQVTVMIALILALKVLFRDKLPVRWHAALWFVLVARMILPWAPESSVSVFNLLPLAAQVETTLPVREGLRSFRDTTGPRQRESVTVETKASVEERLAGIEAARMPEALDQGVVFKINLLPVLWAAGALFVLIYVVVTNRLFLRKTYRERPLTDGAVMELLEDCKESMGLHQPLLVFPAPERSSPALLGFVRPILLMPSEMLDSLSPEQLHHVFLHELAHIKRKDIPLNWLVAVLQAVHWFNPVVWYAFYRMRADRELACDALALTQLEAGNPRDYGNTIVHLLEHVSHPRPLAGMAGILENKTQLKRRIEMINRFKGTSYRWNALSVALLVLFAVVGLSNPVNVSRAAELFESEPPPERTLTFPEDPAWIEYSKGKAWSVRYVLASRLRIRDWEPDGYRAATGPSDWHDLGEALGEVTVPAGKEVGLSIVKNPWGSLAPLAEMPPNTFRFIHFSNRSADIAPSISSADLRIVARQRFLRSIKFVNWALDDDVLAELTAMTSLRDLDLEGTQITDAGLFHIAAMPSLESLNLKGTRVTDAGMIYLADMTALRSLSLDHTDVGDTGLAYLHDLTSLKTLSLNNTKVTDAGLVHLKDLQALRELQVTNTYVTAEGLDLLSNIVPNPTEPFVRSQIRVGLIVSHYQATGPSWIGGPYGYASQKQFLKMLIDYGFDVYAIIDPGSRDLGELPAILETAGIGDVTIEYTDSQALSGLDVIVSGLDANIKSQAAAALNAAIRSGVGFINYSVLGSVTPGDPASDPTIHEMIGVTNGTYYYKFTDLTSRIISSHPIFGPLEVGDPFAFGWLDSLAGPVEGTPLLSTPEGIDRPVVPLYTSQLGNGRIVHIQWVGMRDPNPNFSAEDFMTRCVLWAAKFPLD